MSTPARKRIKDAAGRALFVSGSHERLWRDRALVTCLHSISPAPSAINCPPALFDAYCRFLARYFRVVSLTTLLDCLRDGTDISGMAVITFDDGYLDNAEVAAPILRRYGLPATFFVATDFIGSQHVPWWDEEMSIRSQWMSWDHLRRLRDEGYEIGAHTMSHADLGKATPEETRREVQGSVDAIERELGQAPTLFAYPFGRAENMTEANRKVITELGMACCPSSYGGRVAPGDDPMRLLRTAISPWFLSPYQFGFEVSRLP